MLTFYHAPNSRSIRTLSLLEELGLPYDMRYVTIVHGDGSGRRDAGNIHPDGKVPAIVHDGTLVTESYAIAIYLTDLAPQANLGAPVGSPERGPFLAWLVWAVAEMEPAVWARLSGGGTDERGQRAIDDVMRRIETALTAGPYLMGDRFTAVDVMVAGTLAWARAALPASAAVDAYIARATDRPASATAWAKDAPVPVTA